MSSIGSNASSITVSYMGEEKDVNEAIDDCFQKIQENINNTHCTVRQLVLVPEQDADYMTAAQFHIDISNYIDDLGDLFKELKSVSKQILGKPPKELKEQYKALVDKNKEERKREKEAMKMLEQKEKELDAAMAMASIRE